MKTLKDRLQEIENKVAAMVNSLQELSNTNKKLLKENKELTAEVSRLKRREGFIQPVENAGISKDGEKIETEHRLILKELDIYIEKVDDCIKWIENEG